MRIEQATLVARDPLGRTSAAETSGKKIGPTEASSRTASADPAAVSTGTSVAMAGTGEDPTGSRRVPVGSRGVQARIGGMRLVGGANPEDGEPRGRGTEALAAEMSGMTKSATTDRRAAQERLLVEG